MKFTKFAPKKNLAQAMVEFAIVLPLLLLLLYGLLETGRLLFMYSTIVTASRQAVRYGSATGEGSVAGVPRYKDCAGIRLAANRVDYLNAFDHTGNDIEIYWDNPPSDTTWHRICDGSGAENSFNPTGSTYRLIVVVNGHFIPIVPKIVPFGARTIRAESARTILVSVPIEVPAATGVPTGGGGSMILTVTANPTMYDTVGQTITYTYTVTNTGSVALSGLSISDDKAGTPTCSATTLDPGASTTCVGTYQIIPADMTAGTVVNTATATATDGTNTITATASTTITLAQPKLEITKTANRAYATEGDTVTYSFVVTNTGNVPLTNVTVTDNMLGSLPAGCSGDLPNTGSSLSCSQGKKLQKADISGSTLVNTATATGVYNGSTPKTVTAHSEQVTVYTGTLYLSITASPSSVSKPGQVTFTYTLTNNTKSTTLSAPYSVAASLGTNNCSSLTGNMAAGASKTCTGSYTVTQANLDAGTKLVNTATATAKNGTSTVTSNTFSVSISMVQNAALTMTITDATPNPATAVNTVITYTYTITNSGNVTLSSPKITDTRVINLTCPSSLAPGATQTCTGTYSVTALDMQLGSITNTATASATLGTQTITSASQTYTVSTFVGPRLRLQITPNPDIFTTAGQIIGYTYTITNTGSVALSGITVTDPDGKVIIDCTGVSNPLAPGGSANCVGTYTTTAADLTAQYVATSATAQASDGTKSNLAIAMISVQDPQPLAACSTITTGGTIDKSGNTMSMTINNPLNLPLKIKNVTVQWNHDSGHTGPDTTLKLQSATLGDELFWTWVGGGGGSGHPGPNITISPSSALYSPANTSSTISFNFQQSYDNWDNPPTEYISITLDMPCAGTVITLHR